MTLENVRLVFRLGDTWASDQWAVLVNDLPVDLAVNGWRVLCQARRTDGSPVLHEWSLTNGRVQLDYADVVYGNSGQHGSTSTVQLKHSASESEEWHPFAAGFEVEISRGFGNNIERYTVVSGRMIAVQDLADE